MAEHWMAAAEAGRVLGCDAVTLRRWADAGQLRSRGGAGGMQVLMDVEAAPTVEELAAVAAGDRAASDGKTALALALARAAREEAGRARVALRRAVVGLVLVGSLSAGACGYLAFRAGDYRAAARGQRALLAAEREKNAVLAEDRERLGHQLEQACSDAADAELRLAESHSRGMWAAVNAVLDAFGGNGLSDARGGRVTVASGER